MTASIDATCVQIYITLFSYLYLEEDLWSIFNDGNWILTIKNKMYRNKTVKNVFLLETNVVSQSALH